MRVTQPAVLVGNYDWSEELLPRAEYDARLKQVLGRLDSGLSGLVIYGNKIDNAALAYVSNFAPKIESAIALVTKDGKVRIHAAGSPQMMVNAKRLTWVEDVRPQRDIPKHITEWADEAAGQGALGFWTTDTIPADLLPRIEAGLGSRKLVDVSATMNALLREKSPLALKLSRDACGVLGKAVQAMKDRFNGESGREAATAAARTAADAGAQDSRILISLAKGGTPTAIDYPDGGKFDPLLAYIAVRYAGYWAEGFVTLTTMTHDTITRTQAALKAVLKVAKAGVTVAALRDAAQAELGELPVHPAARKVAVGVGLMLEETEAEPDGVAKLEAGRVYSLRAGATKSLSDNALLSAMVVAKADGVDVLWSALD
ncbi:MAG TPA: M24 family metallopeptidase [Stellaceae bacterium]|jgi:Xaa-Pro aminopeptidase|nr:M24 family metallopeptidase [Stellaceae bacterium]